MKEPTLNDVMPIAVAVSGGPVAKQSADKLFLSGRPRMVTTSDVSGCHWIGLDWQLVS